MLNGQSYLGFPKANLEVRVVIMSKRERLPKHCQRTILQNASIRNVDALSFVGDNWKNIY